MVLTRTMKGLFSLPVEDSQSGMWAIRKSLLDGLDLTSDGMAFSEELKIKAFARGKSTEIPIPYFCRVGRSKLRVLQDGLGNLLFLFRLKLSPGT